MSKKPYDEEDFYNEYDDQDDRRSVPRKFKKDKSEYDKKRSWDRETQYDRYYDYDDRR